MSTWRQYAARAAVGCAVTIGVVPAWAAGIQPARGGAVPAPAEKPAETTAEKVPAVQVVRERYPNRAIKLERHVSQDAKFNFVNHGPWTMWDPEGNMLAKGEYSKGLRQGEWKRWFFGARPEGDVSQTGEAADPLAGTDFAGFKAPLVSKASFVEDKIVGAWTVVDSEGRSLFAVELDHNVPHGKAIWLYANGNRRREIEFKKGAIDGHWQEWEREGKQTRDDRYIEGCRLAEAVSNYESGAKSSEGVYLYPKDDVKVEVEWWSGLMEVESTEGDGKPLKQGKWAFWYEDGEKRYEAEYVDDKPTGQHVWWHQNGQKECEGRYEDGLPVGAWNYWHDNGLQAAAGEYQGGKKVGRWLRWNADGKVIENTEYGTNVRARTFQPVTQPQYINRQPQIRPTAAQGMNRKVTQAAAAPAKPVAATTAAAPASPTPAVPAPPTPAAAQH